MTAAAAPIVALLPMKAHSERVPGKNFRLLAGKPLYAWMLDTLLALDEIECIVINTDAGAEFTADQRLRDSRVLIRPRAAALCGDFVSMNRIIENDIEAVPAAIYLMTHVTNPLLSPVTLRDALSVYRAGITNGEADSLFSVTRHQTRFYMADGTAINHDPAKLIRTQDLVPWFEENSCLYLFSAESFARTGARIGRKPILFEIPKREALDIDTPTDWDMATLLAAGVP